MAIAAAAILWAGAAFAACEPGKVELAGDFGRVSFDVSVADDVDERGRGLMFVEDMPNSTGMLFIYQEPHKVSFWMKNTLIPLDMIFIDARGVVKKVHAKAVPGDLRGISSDFPVLSVLEINGGLAARIGIKPGTLVRHSELPQAGAAYPC
ncbi:DUF192 domain-containing protein [Phaeobacter sp. J2-8]|uniref:DUF192 domain-containing protein n=1 Tax=Phaeobacter sp. J2-8 TaxID=2931394 RepID=UPI001FD5042F|nr:DUF192 domain-containing protein [Phaeobacter sp. J2-8]MCJ7873675.1 DUF192 domain-containing protein [Phaeobacter sp. J2-8]